MGLAPKGAYWSDDSHAVLFARQQSASVLRSYYRQGVTDKQAQELALSELHTVSQRDGVLSPDKRRKAYIYQGNLFVKALDSGEITQLTRQNTKVEGLRFLANGDLAYWQAGQIFRLHADSGLVEQLADIKMTKEPAQTKEPETYLAKEQHKLIRYVAKQQENAKARETYQQQLRNEDPTCRPSLGIWVRVSSWWN